MSTLRPFFFLFACIPDWKTNLSTVSTENKPHLFWTLPFKIGLDSNAAASLQVVPRTVFSIVQYEQRPDFTVTFFVKCFQISPKTKDGLWTACQNFMFRRTLNHCGLFQSWKRFQFHSFKPFLFFTNKYNGNSAWGRQ